MNEHANVEGIYPVPAVMQTNTIEADGASARQTFPHAEKPKKLDGKGHWLSL